jgi:hypothetical protein
MKKMKISSHLFVALAFVMTLGSCKNWSETGTGSLRIITNKDGQTLGYDTTSGVLFHHKLILQQNRAGQESTAPSVKIHNLLQIWHVHMSMGSRHLLEIK